MAKKQLHPGVLWLFRIRSYIVALFLVILLSVFLIPVFLIFQSAVLAVIFVIVLAIVLGEIYVRMLYNRWFYEFTGTNLKLERGVIWKSYSNIPYTRVQNVDIHRGIIARICGFSSVMIQTAGYSAFGGGLFGRRMGVEGYIPAVDINEAEKIRDFLMKKIGKRTSGGL